jgi:hypothetical protein
MKDLLAATERMIKAVKSGEAAFTTPEIKPEYIKRVEELRVMIAKDPRTKDELPPALAKTLAVKPGSK